MVRVAKVLWIVWAILVWNVVFDHVIVVAGREYITAASVAMRGGAYAQMDDWMRPAIARGLWTATAASAVILLVGYAAIRRATATRKPAGSHITQAESHENETVQGEGVA